VQTVTERRLPYVWATLSSIVVALHLALVVRAAREDGKIAIYGFAIDGVILAGIWRFAWRHARRAAP
jgi:hypothetical protein